MNGLCLWGAEYPATTHRCFFIRLCGSVAYGLDLRNLFFASTSWLFCICYSERLEFPCEFNALYRMSLLINYNCLGSVIYGLNFCFWKCISDLRPCFWGIYMSENYNEQNLIAWAIWVWSFRKFETLTDLRISWHAPIVFPKELWVLIWIWNCFF